jgi:hypothetical protein
VEKCGRDVQAIDGDIIRRMRFTYWINKHTLRICNTYCFSKTISYAKVPHCYIKRALPVFSRVTEENSNMFLRGQPIMKPKFEEGISRVRSSIANHFFFY